MLVEILCGGYGCRTKTGIHTVMRGEQCEVSESEARRLIGLGVAKSPYITDRGTASTLAEALSWSGWGSRRVWIVSGGAEP